ncbi:MAG: hypothetical protein MI673_08210 [Thiotrichales bacterium]|nr:hypothetical protein [Thiotrichales bacterium]
MKKHLNRYSARITQKKSQGASQAMLYGTGMTLCHGDGLAEPAIDHDLMN